jgi:ribosome-binding protein aMBF1 (putative translation factor)
MIAPLSSTAEPVSELLKRQRVHRFPLWEPRTFAERITTKWLEQGWSRKLAARYLGIDVTTLRDWEQGKVILFRKHRRLVAQVLGIPESELDGEMKARWRAGHGQTRAV